MIKKIALFLLLILFLLPAQKNLIADVSGGEKVFSQPYITTVMQKTAQWQIADLARTKDTRPTWINAVFYIGIMEAYEATGSEFYLNAALSFSQANNWQPGKRFRHADDLAVGQIYTKLYMIKNNLQMIQAFQNRIDQIMAQPMPGHLDWWWCDALFMAPPGIAELSDATGERKYLDYMDKQWWDTVDYLFDKNEQLFFRDKTF